MATVTLGGLDISDYVENVRITLGMSDRSRHIANVGLCSLVLRNTERAFSPGNASSPFASALTLNSLVLVEAGGYPVFRGYVRRIQPEAGRYHESQRCRIECVDLLGLLQDYLISLPLQENKTPNELLRLITSAALRAACATGTVMLTGNPTDGDRLTVSNVTYVFKNSASAAYEVTIGADRDKTAENLAAAINTAGPEFITGAYGMGTRRHTQVSASYQSTEWATGGTVSIEPAEAYSGAIGLMIGTVLVRPAQQFVPASGRLSSFQVYILDAEGSPGDIQWELRSDNGGLPGEVLQSGTFTPTANSWNTISVSNGPILYNTQTYWLQLRLADEPLTRAFWNWRYGHNVYAGGIRANWISGTWYTFPESDYALRVTTADVSVPGVTLTAVARGAWANHIGLSTTSSAIALSGATLSGGVDEPAGFIDFDTGRCSVSVAADTWRSDSTNALSAIQQVVESEFGYFWCARDGTLTFRDNTLPFALTRAAPALVVNDDHNLQDTSLDLDTLANRVMVSYTPRSTTTSGVIARAPAVLSVPGRGQSAGTAANYTRWNPTDVITQNAGSRTYVIPYVDMNTGRVAGARELNLPLEAGIDYRVYDTQDTSGYNYTNSGRVKFSVAATGSGIEVHLTNTALGTLYVHDLQVRGTALIAYDQLNLTVDDITSQEEYGVRVLTYALPLPIAGGDVIAEQVARYLLSQHAMPTVALPRIGFDGPQTVSGVNLFSLDIGDVVEVSETQTLIHNARHWIIGLDYNLEAQGLSTITLLLAPLGSYTYLALDDPVYGLLNQNRLIL